MKQLIFESLKELKGDDLSYDDVMRFIVDNFSPEEIFKYSQLKQWALEHGFVKKEID